MLAKPAQYLPPKPENSAVPDEPKMPQELLHFKPPKRMGRKPTKPHLIKEREEFLALKYDEWVHKRAAWVAAHGPSDARAPHDAPED